MVFAYDYNSFQYNKTLWGSQVRKKIVFVYSTSTFASSIKISGTCQPFQSASWR